MYKRVCLIILEFASDKFLRQTNKKSSLITLYPKSVRCSVTFAFSRALFAKNTKRRIYIWYCFLVAKMTDANKKRLNTIYPMFANFLTRTPPPKKKLCQCKKKKFLSYTTIIIEIIGSDCVSNDFFV